VSSIHLIPPCPDTHPLFLAAVHETLSSLVCALIPRWPHENLDDGEEGVFVRAAGCGRGERPTVESFALVVAVQRAAGCHPTNTDCGHNSAKREIAGLHSLDLCTTR